MKISTRRGAFLLLPLLALVPAVQAGSATWDLDPASSDWNTAVNWTPATVPNGPTDIATFGVSNLTEVSTSAAINLDSLVFAPDASAFTITLGLGSPLTINGAGIVNNSGVVQTFFLYDQFVAAPLTLTGHATAGDAVVYYTTGTSSENILFLDQSSAGRATFINHGSIFFEDQANAGSATFFTYGSPAAGMSPGFVAFGAPSQNTAERATFINYGATVSGTIGGLVQYTGKQGLGHSSVICYGSSVRGGGGGEFTISNLKSTTGQATLSAYGGTNGGGGGLIQIGATSDGGTSRVRVFGNGNLDISIHIKISSVIIGSLEGDGVVFLGNNTLEVGGNNLDTIFSGLLRDGGYVDNAGGSVLKTGTGRLTLARPNSYTGGTVITSGQLLVNNRTGSGTGSGGVRTNGGTLGGAGIIAGAVSVGTGAGTGASLVPGSDASHIGALTIQNVLIFYADGTCTIGLDEAAGAASEVIAAGVTINSGATFSLNEITAGTLPTGTVLTVISNTGAAPISGTFTNLPDGATISVGGNNFQASYEGGDGNDLTLTVQ